MNQEHKDFDDLIRQRLGESKPPARPVDGWQRLASEMDGDPDYLLRAALTGLSPTDDANGWEQLERKMDPLSTADRAVARKLNGLLPTAADSSWALLSDKLDDAIGEEVDAVVFTQLGLTNPGATSGWAALAARLELIGQRRSIVAAWKITEVSLLLSILLLFVRFGPEYHAPRPVIASGAEGFPVAMAPQKPAEKAPAAEVMETALKEVLPEAPKRITTPQRRLSTVVASTTEISLPMPGATSGQEGAADLTEGAAVNLNPVPVEQVARLDILPLAKAFMMPSPALQLPEVDHSEPVRYYANAFVSPFDFNQVVTPANEVREFDISGDSRITQGQSFGVLLDISQGKNGLQIGAVYGRRSYIPTALKWYLQEEYPLFEPVKGYSRFIYETLSFPLSYQRTLSENDKWRFSGRMGMNMTVIARSSFNIPTEDQELLIDFINGSDRSLALPTGSGGRNRSGASSRKLVNPDPGWLEGGSMLANASFYLGGGLQVERLITPRWSIYLSPSFGRVIYLREKQGTGPYNDRIHTGSIRLGGRYLMSGK